MAQETLRRSDDPNTSGGLSPAGALVRRHDRDRFQTVLFAPAAQRETLFAIYAFNYEIARVRETVREPMLGQIRLQWWREAIAAAYAEGEPRRHDVVEAVTAAIRSRPLSCAHFDRLIDSREHDFDPEPPATLAELEDYAEGSSAPLILLALEVLAAATPAAQDAARHIGIAYALAGILRALPHMERIGRAALPCDIATGSGFEARDIGGWHKAPGLRAAVATIAAVAWRHLAAARARRQELPAKALPALLLGRIAATTLRRLERARFDPYAPAVAAGDPLQPWRLAAGALLRRF